MFEKRVRFIYSTTTDEILYRRFLIRYGYWPDFIKFCYWRKLDSSKKSSMYKFMVSRGYIKWFNLDHRLGLEDGKTIFSIAKESWI